MKEHIIINKDRTVVVPDSVRKIGIQYDHKVNTLTFDCPRYADDNQSIDMSRMAIYINFSRNDKTKGSIAATNIFVDPDNPEIMHFDVVITRSVTLVNGPIICLVCAKSTDAESVEVNHWNSELFNKLSVGEGLEAEELTEEEIDYITSLLQEINTTHAEVADIDTRVEDLEFNQEKQGVVSEVNLDTMTWTDGSYITGSGTVGSSSGYGISELVTLPKMSTLILDATGYQSDVAMIAKSDHTPLVTSVDGKTHYEYYTDEEIQVYISCKTTVAKSAKIVRNVAETLSDLERENSELKGELNDYCVDSDFTLLKQNYLTSAYNGFYVNKNGDFGFNNVDNITSEMFVTAFLPPLKELCFTITSGENWFILGGKNKNYVCKEITGHNQNLAEFVNSSNEFNVLGQLTDYPVLEAGTTIKIAVENGIYKFFKLENGVYTEYYSLNKAEYNSSVWTNDRFGFIASVYASGQFDGTPIFKNVNAKFPKADVLANSIIEQNKPYYSKKISCNWGQHHAGNKCY